MPLNLANLAAARATTTVSWLAETVKVVYNPNLLTDQRLTSFQERVASGDESQADEINKLICDLVTDWDVYTSAEDEEAKRPAPVTQDVATLLPLPLKSKIISQVLAAAGEDPEASGGASAAGSAAPTLMTPRRAGGKSGT